MMAEQKNYTILILMVILFAIALGIPITIKIHNLEITLNPQTARDVESTLPPQKISELSIDAFKSRQETYKLGDTAYADINITNGLNTPYELVIDWLFNNTKYFSWTNISTNFYDAAISENNWYSYYVPNTTGEWEVHFIAKYILSDEVRVKNKTIKFNVIESS